MGKFIEAIMPSEKEYVIRLTQSEVDVIQGMMSDFLDNPQRRVRMAYEVDGDYVEPTERGYSAMRGVFEALRPTDEQEQYDYFDYWTAVDRLDESGDKVLD